MTRNCMLFQGYRYWAGVGVETNCESALTYYRKVAVKGKVYMAINQTYSKTMVGIESTYFTNYCMTGIFRGL